MPNNQQQFYLKDMRDGFYEFGRVVVGPDGKQEHECWGYTLSPNEAQHLIKMNLRFAD